MIRRCRRIARLLSVATAPVVLFGCAAQPVRLDTEAPRGVISGQPGRRGVVVAAPHGTSDVRTGDIAAEIARRTGFGLVVASGVALAPDPRTGAGRRVYEAWEARVGEVAQGPLLFYVEIHGNDHRDAAGRIEVATVGVDREDALRLRALLELIRDAHLRGDREAQRLQVLVEPADTLRYAATGAKRDGILRLPRRALHVELPRAARAEWREVYTAILADFLGQAAALLGGR